MFHAIELNVELLVNWPFFSFCGLCLTIKTIQKMLRVEARRVSGELRGGREGGGEL